MADFSLDMSKFIAKASKNAEAVIRKSALELTSNIIDDTPAATGRAKGNWLLTIDTPTYSTTNETSGDSAKAKARNVLYTQKLGDSIFIQNNLRYIARLEFGLYPTPSKGTKTINGYSTQAPRGFVRINLMKYQFTIDKTVRSL